MCNLTQRITVPRSGAASSPASAERDLGTILIEHAAALRRRPAEPRTEHVGDAIAYAEALIAADQQQRDAARQDVLDGAREIVLDCELDLGPHVRKLGI